MSEQLAKYMLEKQKTVIAAKKIAKVYYKNTCAISGWSKESIDQSPYRLDGAHIYPAGPYPELKKIPANILPLRSDLHAQLDKDEDGLTRSVASRIALISRWVNGDIHIGQGGGDATLDVTLQIVELQKLASELGIFRG